MLTERRSNLPARRTRLIGRDVELKTLHDVALRSDGRLATLTGAGGSGKTSLAMEVGRLALPELADGAWLVDLAPVDEPDLLVLACCRALGLLERGATPREVLVEYLVSRQALLIVDNCEHLAAEVASLMDELLDRCPDVRILATSRVPLHVRGESVFVVPPMPVPPDGTDDPTSIAGRASVELFLERARAVQSGFELTADNARSIGAICRRLAGLPLAIELAAAQLRALSPAEIEARLESEAPLPIDGNRAGPARQQTMDATIEWSHRLLRPAQQALFRRLAVFSGGWTLEAAEAICATGDLTPTDVGQALAGLVEASLVVREASASRTRYCFLSPICEFAWRKLQVSDEVERTSRAHAAYHLALVAKRSPGPVHASPEDLDRIAAEHDNGIAAIRWAERAGDAPTALRFALGLLEYWRVRGLLRLGLRHLEAVLSMLGPEPTRGRIVMLLGCADFGQLVGDYDEAAARAHEAAGACQQLDDPIAWRAALAILGDISLAKGELAQARTWYEQARVILESTPDPLGLGFWNANVGAIALRQGAIDEAEAHLEKARELLTAAQPIWYLGRVLGQLGALALRKGRLARAETLLREALASLTLYGASVEAVDCFDELGRLALEQRDPTRAATLFGAAAGLRDAAGLGNDRLGQSGLAEAIERTRERLTETAFGAAWAEGRAFTLAEATTFASSRAVAHLVPPAAPPGSVLTRREREVARLVARGMTNAQVAEVLVIAPGTVRIHVERILGKLGLTSRVQIATWVVREDDPRDRVLVAAD